MIISSTRSTWDRRGFDFNSIPNLAIDLDARDVVSGSITTINSRVNGYTFTGSATRNTALSGSPTISFNGSSNILTSTANVSQISGANAVTVIGAYQDLTLGSLRYFISNGAGVNGQFIVYWNTNSFCNWAQGNVGITQYFLTKPTAVEAGIWTTQTDLTLATGEANLFRKNGASVAAGSFNNSNNTNTFGNFAISIGAMTGSSNYSNMSFVKLCIYARALSAAEMTLVEREMGILSGIIF